MKKIFASILASMLIVSAFGACQAAPKNEEQQYITFEENLGSEEYGIGFQKEDVALATEVQKILDEMDKDGTIEEISDKWFGKNLYVSDREFPVEPEATDDGSLQEVKDKGVFVMGLDDSFPPMGFRDENNEIVGFDVDLAKEVAKRLGVEFKAQPIDWNAKAMELTSGNIDCVWNGMTITEKRKEYMFLSKPYLDNKQVVIVKDSSLKTFEDLAGKKIGMQAGSSAVEAYEKSELKDTTESVEYDDNIQVFLDLKAGRIDAFLVDEVAGNYIIANDSTDK